MDNSPFNEWLKEFYAEPLKRQINNPMLHWIFDDPNYVYVRPPWHKRIRNRIKSKIYRVRIWGANRLAGYDVEEREW